MLRVFGIRFLEIKNIILGKPFTVLIKRKNHQNFNRGLNQNMIFPGLLSTFFNDGGWINLYEKLYCEEVKITRIHKPIN